MNYSKKRYEYKNLLRALIALILLGFWYGCGEPKVEEEEQSRELALPVEIGKVVYRDVVDEIRTVGNIRAEQRVIITSEVDGKIARIPVEEGMKVAAGKILASIDPREFQLEVERLKAEVEAAQQDYEITLKGLRPEEQERLRAQVKADESALDLALKEQTRFENLVAEQVISQSELDKARDTVRQAEETLRGSKAALAAGLKSRDEDIAMKKSDLESAKKRLAQAELDLERVHIRAPFDGVVIGKKIEQGAYVSRGTAIVEMISSAKLKASIEVPQAYRNKLGRMESIEFFVKDLNLRFKQNKKLKARVRVIPDANIYSGNINVQVDLEKPSPALFPGLTLESVLKFGTRYNVMHVPSISLVITERGTVVYIVKNKTAQMVPVKALKERDEFVEIDDFTHQLGPDADLILRGAGAVFPGVKVFATNVGPEPETPFNAASKDSPENNKKPGEKPKT